MAGFVVRGGSEEAPRGSFLPRFLGFLLLFLVLAHRASAGVFGRGPNGNAQEPESHSLCGFNITRNYLGQFYNKCYKFKSKITYADVSGRGRTNDMTQDQGIVLTSDNKNKFKHYNDPAYNKDDNDKHGSTPTGAVVPGKKSRTDTDKDLVSLYDDMNLSTFNSYREPRSFSIPVIVPIGLIVTLSLLCVSGCLSMIGRCCRRTVTNCFHRTPGAVDAPETQDRHADGAPIPLPWTS